MNWKSINKAQLLVLTISALINLGHAQSRYDPAYSGIAKKYPENLVVFTDRTLYAVNENIHFSALLQSGTDPYHGLGSSVLYAELVDAKGASLTQGKYPIKEHKSDGYMTIPPTLLSGKYHLRCYTRWMRNFGPQDFVYIPIRVVNPFIAQVAEFTNQSGKRDLTPADKGTRGISVSPSRKSYHLGDIVEVEFSLNDAVSMDLQYGCVTVVPGGTIDTSVFIYLVEPESEGPAPFEFNFLPEQNGTSISGTLFEQNHGNPSADTRVHFSILGEDPDYFVATSDQDGRFQINTPSRFGNQEMFVVPEFQPGTSLEVRIDNDFSTAPLPFQPGPFSLQQQEQLIASRLALQMQLRRAYMIEPPGDSVVFTKRKNPVPFYGIPEISVEINEYINLPSLEELIQNLISKIFVMRKGGEVSIMVKSENPLISLFQPLILIDHIPVFEMDVILAIPPSKISRVDVIPEVYVRGEVYFGGIISFTSQKGDLAGIRLPEGSYFFDYASFHTPLHAQPARLSGSGKIPDTRNTLFWMDHLELDGGRSAKISFQASSVPGSYLILYRGVSSDGHLLYGLNSFNVE